MPQIIAKFLGLSNAEEYTGHSFNRSSATFLANTGADLEDSIPNRIDISKKILGGGYAGEEFVMTNAKMLSSTSHLYDHTSTSLKVNVVNEDNYSTNNLASIIPIKSCSI